MDKKSRQEIGLHTQIVKRRTHTEGNPEPIVFWEEGNPRCLVNLTKGELNKALKNIPPAYLNMSEEELERKLKPSWLMQQLRLSFWEEYYQTVDNGNLQMRLSAILHDLCSRDFFFTLLNNSLFAGYLIVPPAGYMYKMQSILDLALRRMHEVLSLPILNKQGVPDTRLIGEIVKIAALVDNRVRGAVTQKISIDQTSKNLNVNATITPQKPQTAEEELAALEAEIQQLKGESPRAITMEGRLNRLEGLTDGREREGITVKTITVKKN